MRSVMRKSRVGERFSTRSDARALCLATGVLLLFLVAACSDGAPNGGVGYEPSPRFITDVQGRALILHGVNVSNSSKFDPRRLPNIDASDAERIARRWGFNGVRYLIFWDAVEPNKGDFDEAYLEAVEKDIDLLASEGIFVILDMHQDVYAAKFCCDGAPDWAIRDDGLPFTLQPSWFLNYFQPAVQRAFDNFWDADGPHADLQEHYALSWQAVAQRFRDHPAVLGYDIMNEPFPGSDVSPTEILGSVDPESRSPQFDREKLQPFYERMISAIREVDHDSWIFYEPRFGGPGNGGRSYLGPFDDPREGAPRIVNFPHLYSTNFELSQNYDPETDPFLENWEVERGREAEAFGGPLLIGEWGLSPSAGGAYELYRASVELADRTTSGWFFWSYDGGGWGLWNPDGTDAPHAEIMVRAYPRAVAGEPVSYGYDESTRCLSLVYEDRSGVEGATEIYVPEARHYPDGWQVHVDAAEWSSTWDAEREILALEIPPNDESLRIFVTPPLSCGDLFGEACAADPRAKELLARACVP